MNNYPAAKQEIYNSYDIDTLRGISEHGCVSGIAHDHIYYRDTIAFFDTHEDEIIDYIGDNYGSEINEELWNNNSCNITGYKNDTVWTYVELIARELIDEFESTTCEELSDLDEDVYPNLLELSNTEWGKDHLELVSL